ncbi:FliH/SctL family protein [Burkholderia paludis]|uniref:FliH/SctL family protein n=1 Tax=Burkholderia paludis TaxID=1506587 RepID=UPI0009DDDDE5|nr:FliH/SctL family protein [Burkholderia paludis]
MNRIRPGVLRGVTVVHDAHVLLRPGAAMQRRGETTPAGEAAGCSLPVLPDSVGTSHGREREDERASGIADGYREGFRQGHDEGRAAGLLQGMEEGRAEALTHARREAEAREQVERIAHAEQVDRFGMWLGEIATGLAHRLSEYARRSEEDMIALCHRALCRVFGETVTHPDSTASIVRQAVAEYCAVEVASTLATLLTVRVHPADAERLEADVDLASAIRRHGVQRVAWIGDEQVGPGGCMIDADHGRLDARLETQLIALTALLSRSAPAAAAEDA